MGQPFLEGFSRRLADEADTEEIAALMDAAIGNLQRGFLSPDQFAVSRSIMRLDRYVLDICEGAAREAGFFHTRAPRLTGRILSDHFSSL
jgi:hypothetical protein